MNRQLRLSRVVLCFALAIISRSVHAQIPAGFHESLASGKLAEAERIVQTRLKTDPGDDTARFGLGTVQFLRAVEARAQGFYRHGFQSKLGGMISLLPIPTNPRPEKIDAAGFRKMLQSWVDDLKVTESTLAAIKANDVQLPLEIGRIRLDLNGDGKTDETESLLKIFAPLNRRGVVADDDEGAKLRIGFDRGDVDWLRGYCHLLSAITEIILAHDFKTFFDHSGHYFFSGAEPPAAFLGAKAAGEADAFGTNQILDLVAGVHLMRFPVSEPDRMKAALGHLEEVIALSRSSWKWILAEKDNDDEWLPNPNQTAAGTSARVTQEMIKGWNDFLDEFEALLQGKKLAPFWRGKAGEFGINVRKVFTEPREFDLVLWVQGLSAAPYLEKGELSRADTWNRLNRVFGGEFLGFAFWFN